MSRRKIFFPFQHGEDQGTCREKKEASSYGGGERSWWDSKSLLVTIFVKMGRDGKRRLGKGNRQLFCSGRKKQRKRVLQEKLKEQVSDDQLLGDVIWASSRTSSVSKKRIQQQSGLAD